MNTHSMLDHRPYNKLARRTAQHSNALSRTNRRRKIPCGKSVRGEVNGARKCKSRAGSLKQSPCIACRYGAYAEE